MSAVLSACAVLPSKFAKSATSSSGQTIKIGVELPLTGDAGADGLRALDALTDEAKKLERQNGNPAIDVIVRDTALGAYQNAHEDEGVDASGLPPHASAIVGDFARNAGVLAAVGGLTPAIASADLKVAQKSGLPLVTLAPAPDRCAAVTGVSPQDGQRGSISIAGAASLESFAVAQVIERRRFREIGIVNDGTGPRVAQVTCFIDALAILERLPASRIMRPDLTSDFATLKQRALAGTIDGFVFFGPAERGTLVCSASGVLLLSLNSLGATAHRGYDSSTLPRDCTWIRRLPEKNEGGLAARSLVAALATSARIHNGAAGSLTRSEVARALMNLMPCSGGSANHAAFAAVPARRWVKSPLTVYDRRCAGPTVRAKPL